MKWRLFIVILVCLSICMGACSPISAPTSAQPPSGSSSPAESPLPSPASTYPSGSSSSANLGSSPSKAPSDMPTSVLLPDKTLLAYETHNLIWIDGKIVGAMAFNGVHFLMGINPPPGTMVTPLLNYLSYDILTKKSVALGTIYWTVGSGSYVIMNGRYFYTWYCVDDGHGGNLNTFYKMDMLGQSKIKTLESGKAISPFVYFSKLNDHEFLTLTFGEQSKGIASATVKKYDSNTDKGRDLFSETYRYTEGTSQGSGTALEKICCHDGKIYGVARINQGNQLEDYLNIYNADGKLEQSIPAPAFKSILEDRDNSTTLDLKVVGKYIVVENWNMEYAIYTMENGQIRELIPARENIWIVGGSDNYSGYGHHAYILYYNFSPDCKFIDNYIFALDAETGQTKRIDVQIDKDYPVMETFKVDESGNILIIMVKDHLDQTIQKFYYVEAKDIKVLLG